MTSAAKALGGLRVRRDFLAAAQADKQVRRAMVVQARDRSDDGPPRFGLTASKKVGNAVARNRTRRRLRALAKEILPTHGQIGFDYVLIGRVHTRHLPWARLEKDLTSALSALHRASPQPVRE